MRCEMLLKEIATVRTGIVATRKKASISDEAIHPYKLLNLKCAASTGYLDTQYAEEFLASEEVKMDFLTQSGDIIVRLSTPYTAIMITKEEWCGYLVPSHFAIIRVNEAKACPEYVLWLLKRDSTKQKILQNISGNGAFGTISSTFFGNLVIRSLSIEKQRIIGQLQLLSDKEQELLHELADQKSIYNKYMINRIYDGAKRGK